MGMDAWLAQAYGTNGAAAEDIEKIAQAEMAQQLAQQEGYDLSGLTEEQIAELGQEVLGGQEGAGQGQLQQPGAPQQQMQPGQQPGQEQGGEIDPSQLTDEHVQQAQEILQLASSGQQIDPAAVQEAQAIMQVVEQMQAQQGGQPQQPQQNQMAKVAEAQAKFEEADYLGRVMAHAFNQEVEKIAAGKLGPANALGVAGHHVRQAGQAVGQAAGKAMGHLKQVGGAAKDKAMMGAAHAGSHIHQNRGAYGLAAGAAGGAALGAGAHHMMSKEATAAVIEKAAMQQAANILSANGIDPATGQPTNQQPQQPAIAPAGGVQQPGVAQPGAQQALGELVEKRSHQILRNLGYNI